MIKLPNIPCAFENHRKMNHEYVCLNGLCQENNNGVACLYCCEEFHQAHIKDVIAIKIILNQMSKHKERKGYNILKLLLQGIQSCSALKELQTNLSEILAYRGKPERFEDLVDEQLEALHKKTQLYYQRGLKQQMEKEISNKSAYLSKPAITPILSFKEGNNFSLNSPFSVTLAQNELTTIFALPSLSKFHQSIDITLKIDRYTPSWLAIGLSIGQAKYEDKSPKHLLAISNGWLANRGTLQKSKIKFGGGDQVRIRWDKNMELLEFITSKNDRLALKFQNKWNEQVYVCVCLFYAGDSVSILA